MLATGNEYNVEKDGVKRERKYTIKQSAKAFKVLSSQLYSDKPRAIIRELSCNAYDAHVEAGTLDKPFIVQLPNRFEPVFKIRDYGTGLSLEAIESLYQTYFESTKTDSNDFIGAFGLGSKSPFSYTDTFSVVSYFNGKKYTSVSFIGEDGEPTTALISECDTDEQNGLEISFAVKNNDIPYFINAAQNVFKWFNCQYTITGSEIDIEKPNWKLEGNGFAFSKISGETPILIMGKVCYPITPDAIQGLNSLEKDFVRYGLCIFANIGDVNIVASREALEYDIKTCEFLTKKVKEIYISLYDEIQTNLNSCSNKWDAQCLVNDLFLNSRSKWYGFGSYFKNKIKFIWNGSHVPYGETLLQVSEDNGNFKPFFRLQRGITERITVDNLAYTKKSLIPSSGIKFVVLPSEDLYFKTDRRIRKWMKENSDLVMVIMLIPKEGKLKEMLVEIGITENHLTPVDKLPILVYGGGGVSGSKIKTEEDHAHLYEYKNAWNTSSIKDAWKYTHNVDILNTDAFYIQYDSAYWVVEDSPDTGKRKEIDPYKIKDLFNNLRYAGIEIKKPIYGVTKGKIKKFNEGKTSLEDLKHFILKSIEDAINLMKTSPIELLKKEKERIANAGYYPAPLDLLKKYSSNKEITEISDILSKIRSFSMTIPERHLLELIKFFKPELLNEVNEYKPIEYINTSRTIISKKYPLLEYINGYAGDNKYEAAIKEYIQCVEKYTESK